MTTNEMATADIREAWIKETRLVLKSDELIKSKRDLYSRVKDNAERKNIPLIVESTFYKYLKAMKLRAMPNGVFAYEDDHTTFFDTLITHMDFVDKVYFRLADVNLGPTIAKIINRSQTFGSTFHCIAIQDLLICLYNIPSVSKSTIIDFVKTTTSKCVLYDFKDE